MRGVFRRHAIGLLAVLLGTAVHAVVVTGGTFDFSAPDEAFTTYYDALGESLLEGRFDVPLSAIESEAYFLHGRVYGYFGPTSAVLRLPLDALFPSMRGLWTRRIMLAACFFTLLATYAIARQARAAWERNDVDANRFWSGLPDGLFVLATSLGTSLFFILRWPILFHEAILVAGAFTLATCALVLRHVETSRPLPLALACVTSLFAFQARGGVGAGAVATIAFLLAWRLGRAAHERLGRSRSPTCASRGERKILRDALAAAVCMSLALGAIFAKNQVVFGNFLGSPPLAHHVQVMNDPARLARTGGRFIQPRDLRTMVVNYLDPTAISVRPRFPYFAARKASEAKLFPETRLDWSESFVGIPAVSSFFCALALVGLAIAFVPGLAPDRGLVGFRIVMAGAALGAGTIFVVACITWRYLHDMLPLLVTASALGFHGLLSVARGSAGARALVLSSLATFAIASAFVNVAATLSVPR